MKNNRLPIWHHDNQYNNKHNGLKYGTQYNDMLIVDFLTVILGVVMLSVVVLIVLLSDMGVMVAPTPPAPSGSKVIQVQLTLMLKLNPHRL
jgi:hypothetical protein